MVLLCRFNKVQEVKDSIKGRWTALNSCTQRKEFHLCTKGHAQRYSEVRANRLIKLFLIWGKSLWIGSLRSSWGEEKVKRKWYEDRRENDASTPTHPPPPRSLHSALAVAMRPTQPEFVYRVKWKKEAAARRRDWDWEIEKYKGWNIEYKRWNARSSLLLPVCFRSAVTERLIPVLVWLWACVHGFWACKERECPLLLALSHLFIFTKMIAASGKEINLFFASLFMLMYIVFQMSPAWVFISSATSGCLTNLL